MHLFLETSALKVKINFLGAEVVSVKNTKGTEYLWQAEKEIWPRHAPVLFPFVGKLKENFFIYEGKKHEMAQHGFARDFVFELVSQTKTSAQFELKSCSNTNQKFPFDFIFQINYQLNQNELVTSYKIINPSNKNSFFSVGAHPGFNCPHVSGEKLQDYYLEFEDNNYCLSKLSNGLISDKKTNLFLNNNKLFLSKDLFNNDALVFENNQINKISLCSIKFGKLITLNCLKWPYFGIWSKPTFPGFICLEPWYGIADGVNFDNQLKKKQGIIELGPSSQFNCSFSLIFH
jgi:galactose mutarotase-like enzyme